MSSKAQNTGIAVMIGTKLEGLKRDLSAFSRALRADYRSGHIQIGEAANKTKFFDSDINNALELLFEAQETKPEQRTLELIGEYYVNLGQPVVARSIFRDCYESYGRLHVTNLNYARIQATTALVDHDKKLLYIPLPKCGSSTIKNYFTFARFGKMYGEFVHFKHGEMYQIITATDLATKFRDYKKFTVVRDPISRIVSYFTSNVVNRALRREAHGCETFMGLSTTPGPRVVARHFHHYRQMFVDFRHHTDAMSGYLRDMLPHLDSVFKMSDLPQIRQLLSESYSVEIPDEKAMVTRNGSNLTDLCKEEFQKYTDFYSEDYARFFK